MKKVRQLERVYGTLNGHTVGIVMKELVRRAMDHIFGCRFAQTIHEKSTRGKEHDFFTNADVGAQQIFARGLRENFPGCGIVGEEGNLSVRCGNGSGLVFSVDPLDGTAAFIRKQSHGIGTMLALTASDRVIAAVVGDVMTREMYYYRPGSLNTHRITDMGASEHLKVDPQKPLREQYVILRDGVDAHTKFMQIVIGSTRHSSLFKNHQVMGGSIGIWIAQLWKGEVGAAVIRPAYDAPWDVWPVIGICRQMGFVFLRPRKQNLELFDWPAKRRTVKRNHEILVVHESRLAEIRNRGLMK